MTTVQSQHPTLAWLSSVDVESTHTRNFSYRADGTSDWLLSNPSFTAWFEGRTRGPVLWGHGLPGTGVTVCTAIAVHHLRRIAGPRDAVTVVYCDCTKPELTATAILSSICAQLAVHGNQLPTLLVKLHAELGEKHPTVDEVMLVMMALLDGFDRVFVCIDALDELDRDGERPVLLQKLHWMRNRGVHLFVTSTTHADMSKQCEGNEDIELAMEGAEEMLIEAVEDDIRKSVAVRLQKIPGGEELLADAGEDPNEVIEQVVGECAGMFMMAHLKLDRKVREAAAIQKQREVEGLQEFTPLFYARALVDHIPSYSGELPFHKDDIIAVTEVEHENRLVGMVRGLTGSFATIKVEKIEDIAPKCVPVSEYSAVRWEERLEAVQTQHPRRRRLAMAILTWVAHAKAAFAIQDLARALSCKLMTEPDYRICLTGTEASVDGVDGEAFDSPIEGGSPNSAISINDVTNDLVVIEKECGTLSLNKIWKPSPAELTQLFPKAHLRIASKCLEILLASLDVRDRQEEPQLKREAPRVALKTYAEENWGYHASFCKDPDIDSLVLEYLVKLHASKPSWIEERRPFFSDPYYQTVVDDETPVLKVARHGLNNTLRALLEGHEYDVNAISYNRETALSVAVKCGFTSTAHLLYRYGASLNYKSIDGKSLLHMAAARNDEVMVALLIRCGLAPNTFSAGASDTALDAAVAAQSTEAAKVLLEMRAEVTGELVEDAARSGNLTMVKLLAEHPRGYNLTPADGSRPRNPPLFAAVESGSIPVVQYMLRNGVRIGQLNDRRSSVIHFAALHRKLNMVKFLVENAEDPMIAFTEDDGPNQVCNGTTAVEAALHGISEPNVEIVEYLLSRMPSGVPTKTLLGMAAGLLSYEYADLAKSVIAMTSGPLEHARRTCQDSLMGAAARENNTEILKILLQRGMDAGVQDQHGWSPLHVAASQNADSAAKFLISHGVDIDQMTKYAMTPVHVAVHEGGMETLRVLLDHKPDLSLRADDGSTALVAAGCSKQLEAARILLVHMQETEINTPNIDGETLLHYAVMDGDTDLAGILLNRGIDKSIISRRGGTALHYAACKGNLELVKLLLGAAAEVDRRHEYSKPGYQPPDTYGDTDVVLWNKIGEERFVRPRYWGKIEQGWTALHSAACAGNEAVVSCLISHGASVFARGAEAETPLHVAASAARSGIIKILIGHGADIGAKTDTGETALYWAALATAATEAKKAHDHFKCCCQLEKDSQHASPDRAKADCVAMLLRLGADPTAENNQGASPLSVAVAAGHDDVVDTFLKHMSPATMSSSAYMRLLRACEGGASSFALEKVSAFFTETPESRSAWSEVLGGACMRGDGGMAALAIRKGATLLLSAVEGKNPFHQAVLGEHEQIVQALLAARCGADLDIRDEKGRNALHLAVGSRDPTERTLTVYYGSMKRENIVRMLLAAGARTNERTPEGTTALHIAVGAGDLGVVSALLEYGASVDIRDARGRTAIHASVSGCTFLDIVEKVVAHGACPSATDMEGYTPLHLIRAHGDEALSVLNYLVKAGADVSAAAANGDRPLHCAVRRGNWSLAEKLVDLGADVSQKGAKGRTPLHVAARYGQATFLEKLVNLGAKLSELDAAGWTAAHHAVHAKDVDALGVVLDACDREGVGIFCASYVPIDAVLGVSQEFEGVRRVLDSRGFLRGGLATQSNLPVRNATLTVV